MVIRVPISADAEAKLKTKAAAAGVDLPTFASNVLERVAARPSLDEALAPLRAEFDQSGMTDDELGELLEQTKHQARGERRARRVS